MGEGRRFRRERGREQRLLPGHLGRRQRARRQPGAGGRLRLTVRQESIAVSDTRLDGLDNSFAGTLVLASFAGSTVQYVIRLSDGVELIAESRADRGRPLPAPPARGWGPHRLGGMPG